MPVKDYLDYFEVKVTATLGANIPWAVNPGQQESRVNKVRWAMALHIKYLLFVLDCACIVTTY